MCIYQWLVTILHIQCSFLSWEYTYMYMLLQGWASKLKHRAKVVKEHSTVEPMPIHSTDDHPPPPKKPLILLNIAYRKHFHMKHFIGATNLLNSG